MWLSDEPLEEIAKYVGPEPEVSVSAFGPTLMLICLRPLFTTPVAPSYRVHTTTPTSLVPSNGFEPLLRRDPEEYNIL
jgi:hypothetical protein